MAKLSGFGGRLYSGEISFNIVENRKRWYSISAVFIIASMAALGTSQRLIQQVMSDSTPRWSSAGIDSPRFPITITQMAT